MPRSSSQDEAERFDSKLAERASLQTEFYLWQIFHIDTEISEREDATSELKSEFKTTEAAEKDAEKKLKELKKTATAARRTLSSVEKTRVTLAGSLSSMQPDTIKTQQEVLALTKQVQADSDNLTSLASDKASHEEVMADLTTDIDGLTAAEKKLEEEYKEVRYERMDRVARRQVHSMYSIS